MKKNRKKDANDSKKSWSWIIALPMIFLYRFIPHKPLVILCLVSVILTLAINVIVRLVKKEWNGPALLVLTMIGAVSLMNLLITANYTYVGDDTPLLAVSTILGIFTSIVVTICFFRHKYKALPLIGLSLCLAVLFWAIFLFTSYHLNYLFDPYPPTPCEAIIEDKDIDHNRKGPDDYELIVTIDEKRVSMEVSSDEYHRYDIGDTYTFYRHQGAFDIPFYFEE